VLSVRKAMKLLHTIASCGLVGGLLALIILLVAPPQEARAVDVNAIGYLSRYLIFPSLAVVLVTGLLAMVVHRPFQEMRWVWVKVFLGVTVFEAALGVITRASDNSALVDTRAAIYEIGALLLLAFANVILAIWRPRLDFWRVR
jgi:hypothetical protein